MTAKIYKPAKNAMQSGEGRMKKWLLEYEPEDQRKPDPLMGWTSSGDTKSQLRLRFSSREEAEAYAKRNGLAYTVQVPHKRNHRPRTYADNFSFTRKGNWTH